MDLTDCTSLALFYYVLDVQLLQCESWGSDGSVCEDHCFLYVTSCGDVDMTEHVSIRLQGISSQKT